MIRKRVIEVRTRTRNIPRVRAIPELINADGTNEQAEFVRYLQGALYWQLPRKFNERLRSKVDRVILGASSSYLAKDIGAYSIKGRKVYISSDVLSANDPQLIAEVFYYECGHPLLNRLNILRGIDDKTSAEFLVHYSFNDSLLFNRSKDLYQEYAPAMQVLLGDNTGFVAENTQAVLKRKEEWYKRLGKELCGICGIELPAKWETEISPSLRELYPYVDEMVEAYNAGAGPYGKFRIKRNIDEMEDTLNCPVRDFSGCVSDIPYELAEEIGRRTGIYLRSHLMTPKNDVLYTLKEILARDLRFDIGHPL